MSEKRTQFFGELYTGERAEYKNTSVRLPAGLVDDLKVICEAHGFTQSQFMAACIVEGMGRQLAEDSGSLSLMIDNPQKIKQPTEETRAEIMAILADVAALKIDKRAGFNTGITQLINYHFEKLCKENNGEAFTGEYIAEAERKAMRENARKEG